MSNTVEVTLRAKDLLSPAIARIKGDLNGLSQPLSRLSNGSMFGGLTTGLLTAGLTQSIQGFQAMGSAIKSASEIQVQTLAQSGDLAQQLKVNFKDATGIIKETQKALGAMAAELPGDDRDYFAAFSQLSGISSKLAKGDVGQFKEISLNLAKRTALLSSIQGTNPTQSANAVSQFISGGKTASELYQYEIFSRSSVLRDSINEQLKGMGKSGRDLKTLSNEQRATIITNALTKAVPEDLINASKGTVAAQLATIQSKIFNPQTGIFGFLREIKDMGNRTALDAVQGFLTAWTNLAGTLGEIGQKLGISFDPMEAFIAVTDWFTNLGNTVNGFLNGGNLDSFTKIFDNLSTAIPTLVDKVFSGLNNVLSNTNWLAVGAALNKISFAILNGLVNIDWGLIGQVVFKALIVAPIGTVTGAIANAAFEVSRLIMGDVRTVGTWIAQGFQKLFSDIFTQIGNAINGALASLTQALSNIGSSISNFSFKLPQLSGTTNNNSTTNVVSSTTNSKVSNNQTVVTPQVAQSTKEVGAAFKSLEIPLGKSNKQSKVLDTPSVASNILEIPKVPGKVLEMPSVASGSTKDDKGKSIAYSPTFNIQTSPGADNRDLVALIRSTINDDWVKYNNAQLA
jgi:hypothetical protein